jgi:hypothetical protein
MGSQMKVSEQWFQRYAEARGMNGWDEPIMVALGTWGLVHRDGERRLRVRAELLRDGGPT